jgi:hypothetical protein
MTPLRAGLLAAALAAAACGPEDAARTPPPPLFAAPPPAAAPSPPPSPRPLLMDWSGGPAPLEDLLLNGFEVRAAVPAPDGPPTLVLQGTAIDRARLHPVSARVPIDVPAAVPLVFVCPLEGRVVGVNAAGAQAVRLRARACTAVLAPAGAETAR